ncbi:MAG TPA: hypothetical protein VI358_13945 [Pseudolabrys sp.]
MSKKERDDVALSHEFWDRLCASRAALRSASTWGTPSPENMDINTTAYMVAIKIGDKYSFSKVLSELVANQDALRPDIRRFLVKRLRIGWPAPRRVPPWRDTVLYEIGSCVGWFISLPVQPGWRRWLRGYVLVLLELVGNGIPMVGGRKF